MIITHNIEMDLSKGGAAPRIQAVQDDKYSRNIVLTLFSDAEAWMIPEDATGIVHYGKPDGTGGSYTELPDGTAACCAEGNTLTIALAPQVCTAEGIVQLAVSLVKGQSQLHTFPILVHVLSNPERGMSSEAYFSLCGVLPYGGWAPNKYLGTDASGNVVAADAPEGTGSTENGSSAEAGGYYAPAIEQTDANTMRVSFTASKEGMASVPDKSITLPAGPAGEKGATGATGPAGADGEDYVLTQTDKAEIAEMVENATIVQAPKYVSTVDEMTDTDRPYVLIETGHIWANAETTVISTKKENAGMPLFDNSRLGSDGSTATDATAYAAYVATDYIDLLAYPLPFKLHIDGGVFLPPSADSYTRMGTYTADKAKINVLQPIQGGIDQILNVPDRDVTVDSSNNLTITFNQTPTTNNANNDGVLRYVRFSGKGEPGTVSVYVTYEAETTGMQWFDTGATYAPGLTAEDKAEIAEEVAAMVDVQLLSVIGDGAVTV